VPCHHGGQRGGKGGGPAAHRDPDCFLRPLQEVGVVAAESVRVGLKVPRLGLLDDDVALKPDALFLVLHLVCICVEGGDTVRRRLSVAV
jgi:hypothetical protein